MIHDLKVIVEVGKYEKGKIKTRVEQHQLRLLELPAAVLHLEFGFDNVGGRDFASMLELLRNFQKPIALVCASFRSLEFVLSRGHVVKTLHDGHDEAPRCNFSLCASNLSHGRSAPPRRS